MSEPPGRHRFYGRRKGHALRRHHLRLMEELLPVLRVDLENPINHSVPSPRRPGYAEAKLQLRQGEKPGSIPSMDSGLRWNDETGVSAPLWLEIGFGGGEHLAHQAALHPEVNFIGAEPFVNGVAKLLALIEEKHLGNIRIHDGDARDLLERLPDASLDRIYLLYPDPWPKARHRKRRFVSPQTIAQIQRLLGPGGLFMFASDSTDYVDWTLREMSAHGGFSQDGDPALPFEDWVETRYEAKARREGRAPSYLTFRKTH